MNKKKGIMLINDINQFVDLADKNRRYNSNTARGLKAAIKRLEGVLNPEESESLDLILERFDPIMHSFFEKNKSEMTVESMEVYKRRLSKVLRDFKKWGPNPSNWGGWSIPKPRTRVKTSKPTVVIETEETQEENETIPQSLSPSIGTRPMEELTRFEISLRPGVKAFISTPVSITAEEVEKLQKYIDYLRSIAIK